MSEPFVGEIRCFGFNFAPRGWAFCDGQLLPISQNDALFAILGTIYGGDGRTTFALPNLQGRIPMHWGTNPPGRSTTRIGEVQGTPSVTLNVQQIPQHIHDIFGATVASADERAAKPSSVAYLSGSRPPNRAYENPGQNVTAQFSPKTITQTGGSQAHNNMQPFLVLNFCIALVGVFPSRN